MYLLVEWLETTKNDYVSVGEWQCERIQSIFSLRIKYMYMIDWYKFKDRFRHIDI